MVWPKAPRPRLPRKTPGTEVRLIHFGLAHGERRPTLTLFGDVPPNFEIDHGDALAR